MCDSCTREAARLSAELELLDFEVSIIQAEADAGLSYPGATRILTDLEMRSGVRFAAIDDLHARTAGLIARLTGQLEQATISALLADLRSMPEATAAMVLARLTDLASPVSSARLPLAQDVERTVAEITDALARTQVAAAGHVLEEARSQGVTAALLADQNALKVTPEQRRTLVAQAQAVAGQPVTRVLTTASTSGRAAARPAARPADVLDAVDAAVNKLTPAALEDQARQATTAAVNTGRRTALEAAPPPQQVQASELLDSSTCRPCADVDGRIYATLSDALVDYPSGGSYGGCLGGERCRGTLVAVWEAEVAPTLEQPGDRPPGPPLTGSPLGPTAPGTVAVPQAVGDGRPLNPPPSGPVPKPPPLPGTPTGTPVSAAISVPNGTKTFQSHVQQAVDAIDQAHGDGLLPKIEIRSTSSKNTLGEYSFAGQRSHGIKIQAEGTWPGLTTIHEIGHFLDHQAIGTGASFGTRLPGVMDEVRAAIGASDAVAKLTGYDLSRFTGAQKSSMSGHLQYLLGREELWARAYAQWVAEKTANRTLLAELAAAQDYGRTSGIMRQWETDDFAPIADAIAKLMKDRGWTT